MEVVNYGGKAGAGSTGIHTVLKGDTVYTVAKQYNLPLRDIITLNGLPAPYRLARGYRLKLPPPNEYKVRPGDTLNGISRLFNASVSETAKINNLSSPYAVRAGQVLRLPSQQPKLLEEFASDAPSGTFSVASEQGTAVQVASVESEVLAPPPGQETPAAIGPAPSSRGAPLESQKAASYEPAAASDFPPSPAAPKNTLQVPSATSGAPLSASAAPSVQPASAAAVVAPKIPARMGAGRFMRPVDGKIISAFGPKDDGLHNDGINIKAAKGTAVRAADNGVVAYTGSEMAGYGNLVLIRHQNRWMTAYAHMDKMLVKKGEVVKAGQSIGTVGRTGQVDAAQLHFEVRKGAQAVDPAKYL